MADKATVNSLESPARAVKAPENSVIVNPDEPPYDTLHLCIYMRELMDEAEEILDASATKRASAGHICMLDKLHQKRKEA
jgi:hypothetical protein